MQQPLRCRLAGSSIRSFCSMASFQRRAVKGAARSRRSRFFRTNCSSTKPPTVVLETIADLSVGLGGARQIVIARELTKLFETIHTCRLDEAEPWLRADANRQKGEFVLIVQGASRDKDAQRVDAERVLKILLEDLPVKQAAALAARITGGRKNELYARALELKREP